MPVSPQPPLSVRVTGSGGNKVRLSCLSHGSCEQQEPAVICASCQPGGGPVLHNVFRTTWHGLETMMV